MHTEEVVFTSDSLSLAGTLTTPANVGPFPCVSMVHGSGPQDRNGDISGFMVQIFKFLAEDLAEHGIASLRYDKRGCGKSAGNFKIAGLSEMVDDACSAIDFLKVQPSIDKNNIYVLGHSEGAVLAPEICIKKPNLAGIIMLCASLRSFEEDGVKNAHVFNRDLHKMTGLKGKLARFFLYSKDPLKTMIDLRKKVETTKAKRIWVSFTRVSSKFYRETYKYDVKSYLAQTKHPILAIGGSKDFQCHPDDTRLIPSISPSESEIHIIDDMDHMLRLQQGEPTLLSYADAGTKPMVQDVKDLVCSWVKIQKANRALNL